MRHEDKPRSGQTLHAQIREKVANTIATQGNLTDVIVGAIHMLAWELDAQRARTESNYRRIDAIEKRHADHDDGLRASAGVKAPEKLNDGDILPCPFCGISGHIVGPRRDGYSWINCGSCGADGPHCLSLQEAIADWNKAKR